MRKFAPVLVSGVMALSFSGLAFSQGSGSYQDQKDQKSGYSQPAPQGADSQYKQPQAGGSAGSSSTYPSTSQPNASSGASGDERHENKGRHEGDDKYKNKDKDKDQRGDNSGPGSSSSGPGGSRY